VKSSLIAANYLGFIEPSFWLAFSGPSALFEQQYVVAVISKFL
jgi:hypothetical protein